MRERGHSPSYTKACLVTPVNFVSLNYSQQQFVLSSAKVILRLFKDIHKSISWSAKKRQVTGNIIIRPRCPKITLRKDKTRKNSESKENNISSK